MTIEALLAALKESLDANTAALKAAGASAGASATAGSTEAKTTKTTKTEKKEEPKVTQEQMNAALIKIKDDFGMPEAKKIISEHGGVEKMAEIKPAKYQAVYDAAIAKHAELSAGTGGEDDGGI